MHNVHTLGVRCCLYPPTNDCPYLAPTIRDRGQEPWSLGNLGIAILGGPFTYPI